jgi:hypothetical protein
MSALLPLTHRTVEPVRIGIALAAQPPAPSWSRPPASVVLPFVRALPRCRRAPPGGRAASMLRLVRRGQPAASRRSQPAPRPGLARLRSPRGLRSPARPLRDPSAIVSPSSCLAANSSRRPPSSRGELRLPPRLPFVYPLRTAPSHPRCHTIRLACSTSDLRASHVLSCVSSRVVRAPFSACRVRSRRPFACSCTRVRSACYLCAVSRMLFAHTEPSTRPYRDRPRGTAARAKLSRLPASVVPPSVRALPRCRRASPGGRAASMLWLVRRGQPAASRRSQPAPRAGLARLRSPDAARTACVVRLGPCATPAQ